MSYLSLARQYRPRQFADMVGQEPVTIALANAIKLKREPHGVIFTGVRGIGKTTAARIYAKALNCENGPTPEPCDVCASCLAIQEGHHEDVLEIDGASNTGVDDIRILQETLNYVPQRSTFKIYIIDEVHMLSVSAFNALLKTLEEPPSHVAFIFATTDLHKVPETIQSRCQTFHLQKINRQDIYARLEQILCKESIEFEVNTLQVIAREGRGSLRDALTILDQAIAVGDGKVTQEAISHLVGRKQSAPIIGLLGDLVRKESGGSLRWVALWDQEGLEMTSLVEELAKACRNAFILRDVAVDSLDIQILDLEDKEKLEILAISKELELFELNRLFRSLVKCLDDLKRSDIDRCIVENYFLEWCLDPGLPNIEKLLAASLQGLPQTPNESPKRESNSETFSQRVGTSTLGLKDRWKQKSADQPLAASASEKPSVERQVNPEPSDSVNVVMPDVGKPRELKGQGLSLSLENARSQAKEHPEHHPETSPVQPESGDERRHESNSEPGELLRLPQAASGRVMFPQTWREFVEIWKKQKPLQARVLEEAYIVEYSQNRICLAVDPNSMVGGKLLQVEARKKLKGFIEELFVFDGLLEVIGKGSDQQEHNPARQLQQDLGESLLETRQKEKEIAREELLQKVEEHPLTQDLMKKFNGIIESIDIH